MPYLHYDTILSATKELTKVKKAKGAQAHPDSMALYLLLKKHNVSTHNWSYVHETFAQSKESWLHGLAMLGAIFSPDERPGKSCCLFFTGFDEESPRFFNKGSSFSSLPSRSKDTIDNSIADLLLIRSSDKIKFEEDYIKRLTSSYTKKFSLLALACWSLRFQCFDEKLGPEEIKKIFCKIFNISDYEIYTIFNEYNDIEVKYQDSSSSGRDIRVMLGLDKNHEINQELTALGQSIDCQNNYFTLSSEVSVMDYAKYNGRYQSPKEIYDVLRDYKQVILTGVPGVGKTYVINSLKDEYKFDVRFVQFHQSYSYQDFVIGKTIYNNSVKIKKGFLLNTIDLAKQNPSKFILLVLDEINRGNVSSIFGELLLLLDRKNIGINIATGTDDYGNDIYEEIRLPENLYILGTMNTSDRSIAIVDFALRRRFAFIKLNPNYELLNNKVIVGSKSFTKTGFFLKVINNKLQKYFSNEDFQLGHSFFLRKPDKEGLISLTEKEFLQILQFEIMPMLTEFNNGDSSILTSILGERLVEADETTLYDGLNEYLQEV